MSEQYRSSLNLYNVALNVRKENPDDRNIEFNIESALETVHGSYMRCLEILHKYARTHGDSVVAYSIWHARKRFGIKFIDTSMIVGAVKGNDIRSGMEYKINHYTEIRKILENYFYFNVSNLNPELFERASQKLEKIKEEEKIKIDYNEAKLWSRLG